jgi:hypothetical protein
VTTRRDQMMIRERVMQGETARPKGEWIIVRTRPRHQRKHDLRPRHSFTSLSGEEIYNPGVLVVCSKLLIP